MHTLICGSIAYDTIMVFPDRFKNHILPDQIHILNLSFMVPTMRREFGGCAGNIAYTLKLLGGSPKVMASVGEDIDAYFYRMDKLKLDKAYLKKVPDTFTAQAFITTDLDDNQITAFHPGAMSYSHLNRISEAENISLGIVAPDGRDGMLQHAREFADLNIPFMFDPGQGLPMFSGPELMEFIKLCDFLAVNDYEGELIAQKTGKTISELAKLVSALIVTKGSQGSIIYAEGQRIDIPCVKVDKVVDPTGCGDAYRSGLLYGIANKMDWQTTGQLASLMGAIKIASRGAQNHHFTRNQIGELFHKHFAKHPW